MRNFITSVGRATVALVFTSSLANAGTPAWERANFYTCRADTLRICESQNAVCEVTSGSALFYVNFASNTFSVAGGSPGYRETIVARNYSEWPEDMSFEMPDQHYIVMSGGARILIFGPDEDAAFGMPAQFVDAEYETVRTHFLRCFAEER